MPIWTNSHGYCGLRIATPPFQVREIIRIDQVEVFIVLPGDHRIAPPSLRGNSAMPLFTAAEPRSGDKPKRQEVAGLDQLEQIDLPS